MHSMLRSEREQHDRHRNRRYLCLRAFARTYTAS
jgi:hypothetical protein